MVRHCAVPGCNNTDLTTLCHRFPRRKDAFEHWTRSLQLDFADTTQLMHRSVVCTSHFPPTDYRNASSRMLNSMAVPQLAVFSKGPFYDSPTMAVSAPRYNYSINTENSSSSSAYVTKIVIRPVEVIKANEYPDTEETVSEEALVVVDNGNETIEVLQQIEDVQNEDDMGFYIEEEAPLEENTAESSEIEQHLEQSENLSSPLAKRLRSDADEELKTGAEPQLFESIEDIERLITKAECSHATTQTEDVEIVTSEEQVERQMADEFYPECASYSRLELIKQLKEKDERLAEMTKKMANFESAHAAMMKTMESFKSIMNI